jgi:hypothetical protein
MHRSIAVVAATMALVLTAAVPTVTSAGLLPIAVNDAYTVVHGKTRTVAAPGVLANDLQLGGGFTADLTNDVDQGALDLDSNGSFTYTSGGSFIGTYTFRYRVDGGLLGLSNTATVTITVTNDAPVARPDSYSAVADIEKSIAVPGVLGNDDDADGDRMTIDVVQEPAHGNLNERDDGSFRYKAEKGFGGTDTWRYRVWDGFAWSNSVIVTMDVSAPATPKPTSASTPAPTPRPTPAPTSLPTIGPILTLPPLPSILPLPSLLPQPTPTRAPTPRPSASPSPRPSAPPTATPTPQPTTVPLGLGPITPARPSPSDPRASSSPPTRAAEPPFTLPSVDDGAKLDFDTGTAAFDGFEWAVPALVLTVPGILIVIAVLAQALIGLAWLPITRRWLGGGRRRPTFASGALRR